MTRLLQPTSAPETGAQQIGRVALGSAMVFAGIGHLTFARQEFRTQVLRFVPRVSSSPSTRSCWPRVSSRSRSAGR